MHLLAAVSDQRTGTDITEVGPSMEGKDEEEATIDNDLTREAMLDTNRMSNEDRGHGLSR